jgi:hypothetical protein
MTEVGRPGMNTSKEWSEMDDEDLLSAVTYERERGRSGRQLWGRVSDFLMRNKQECQGRYEQIKRATEGESPG